MRGNLREHLWRIAGVVLFAALLPGSVRAQAVLDSPQAVDDPRPYMGDSPPPPPATPGEAAPPLETNQPAPSPFDRAGGLSNWMNPTVGHLLYRSDYRAMWLPDEPVRGQPTNLGYVEQDLSVSAPLWQNAVDEWSAMANVRSELFHTGAILPDTRQPFPDDLWNVRLGADYRHLCDNGWIAGGSFSFGSASDQPFSTIHEMVVTGAAFVRVPQGEHNAWLFSLNYSTNSEVLAGIPIPGVAYFYAPTPWFQATVGLPFANVVYRPTDDLTLQLSYALLTTVHARATYRVLHPLRLYVGYDNNNESYYLADRPDDRDRFFYYSQRVVAGVQWNLAPQATLDLGSGYVFDRYYFEGRSFTDRDQNRVDVGDAPFVALRVEVRY